MAGRFAPLSKAHPSACHDSIIPSGPLTASSAARQERATYASVLLWLLPTVNDELVVHRRAVRISQRPATDPPSRGHHDRPTRGNSATRQRQSRYRKTSDAEPLTC